MTGDAELIEQLLLGSRGALNIADMEMAMGKAADALAAANKRIAELEAELRDRIMRDREAVEDELGALLSQPTRATLKETKP